MLNSEDMTDLLISINDSVSMVDSQIRKDLRQNMDGLIHHSLRIKQVHTNFAKILDESKQLKSNYDLMKSQVLSPIQELRQATQELELLEEAIELIRNCHRTFQLVEKSNELWGSRNEEAKVLSSEGLLSLARIAQLLSETNAMISTYDLAEMQFIKSEIPRLKSLEGEICQESFDLLVGAMRTNNQSDMGAALQVFFNLHNLAENVEKAVNSVLDQIAANARESFDVSTVLSRDSRRGSVEKPETKGKPGVAVSNNQNTGWRLSLWLSVERFFDQVLLLSLQVHTLERVVFRKVDPTTDTPFFAYLNSGDSSGPFSDYWTKLLHVFEQEFASASRKSTFVRKILTNDFAKLESMLSDFFARLSKHMEESNSREEGALKETWILTDVHHKQLLSSISKI
eukprot:TRINITY_DN7722_c0_g2_i1.p1 TRINITY_DN7722_c0_g2~~TRINITY_DN7722_c0_g2_i1.p1  ORF type:complete len:399 (+),score=103.14 TRINITY_DN7722_c0_g2_i1:245-1441(+)